MTLKKQTFLLRDKNVTTTRAGSLMLRVTLADRTGTVTGVYFDVPGYVADSLVPGKGVEVTGRMGEFKGQPQLTIERIVPVQLSLSELGEFLPTAQRPMQEMLDEFDALRASIEQPDLERLLAAIFDDPQVWAAFCQAPAAKLYHHACIGGLLEHTLSVARLALTACDLYPGLDRDLVVTVALLHDLGKINAYDATTFELTSGGCLWGHLYMTASYVERVIANLPDFDAEMGLRVVHAILAHHGRLEYGSPVRPMTLEAIVLHYADNLDADARGAIDHLDRAGSDSEAFTDHSFMHDTRLYRGNHKPSDTASPGRENTW
ncbi:MAG: HD domain-containing protein [Chloroflexi bacterium]|nr:HD domain-containing protein [Chloroflexota bacterium]